MQYNVPADYLLPTSPKTLKNEVGSYQCNIDYASFDVEDCWIRNGGYVIGLAGTNADTFLVIAWAGFQSVPYDIRSAIVDAVKIRYNLAQVPLNLHEQDIGRYRYKMKAGDYTDRYNAVVATYRRTGIAGR